MEKLWNEVKVLTEPHGVELSLEPPKSPAEPLLSKLNIFSPSKQPSELRVVFLHEYNAKIGAWVRAHDEGAMRWLRSSRTRCISAATRM